jgi:hypothetical protein
LFLSTEPSFFKKLDFFRIREEGKETKGFFNKFKSKKDYSDALHNAKRYFEKDRRYFEWSSERGDEKTFGGWRYLVERKY